jgi:hypothetical protein
MDPYDLCPDARGTIAFGLTLPEEFETWPDMYEPASLLGLMGRFPATFCNGVSITRGTTEPSTRVEGIDDWAFPLELPTR